MAVNVRVANNAFGQLASSVSASETTISLEIGNAERFPTLTGSQYFYATMVNSANQLEIVKVTAVNADNFTVLRAQDGTTAKEFDAGDRIELRPVAALFEDYIEGAIEEVQDSLGTMSTQDANAVAITGGSIDATIAYDNNASGLTATNVQQAIDETNTRFASLSGRNRIINGDMRIDQRNNGASVAGFFNFAVDRFSVGQSGGETAAFTQQRDTLAPVGFNNSLKFTVTTPQTSFTAAQRVDLRQRIEGFNVADLGFGTANALTVTLSFWVRSSLTGTFGGSILNGAGDRAYPYSYTINAANTFEYKTVTIPGDTTGTWAIDNSNGMTVAWCLGGGTSSLGTAGAWTAGAVFGVTGQVNLVGTNGATFNITGVQFEAGSVATPFERRPFGTELALCQRYFQVVAGRSIANGASNGFLQVTGLYPVPMRATPTRTGPTSWGTNAGATPSILFAQATSIDYLVTGNRGDTTQAIHNVGFTLAAEL